MLTLPQILEIVDHSHTSEMGIGEIIYQSVEDLSQSTRAVHHTVTVDGHRHTAIFIWDGAFYSMGMGTVHHKYGSAGCFS